MMRKVSLFFGLICLVVQLWAKNESTSSYPISGSQVVVGARVAHADPYFNMSGTPTFKDRKITGSVEFKLDVNKQAAINIGEAWTYSVTVKASFYNRTGQLINGIPVEKILTVEQNAQTGMKAADLDAIDMQGAYKVVAEVKAVSITKKTTAGTTVVTDNLPNFISLRTAIQVERFYDFDPTVVPFTAGGLSHEEKPATKSLEMHWDYLVGAEEYELEYTYIDDYKESDGIVLKYDFKNNATRIITQNNSYQIPVLYDKGFLIYRVRGVGRTGDKSQTNLFGKWSNNNIEQGDLSTFDPSHTYTITKVDALLSKNWQYSVDFAEEGKRKDHIVYYDGSLRTRQEQAINNTEKEVVVGETIYDHVGRPVIATLPVPVKPGTDNNLYYKENFTLNTQGNKYSKEDFDKPTGCNSGPAAMGTGSGASNYYSPANPNKEGKNAYIPDAKGFPFTQIEYTPDPTGRVNRQSGVGIDHMLDSNHETKYSYATPSQVELDAMFGLDAGINTHYRKNIVKDPNGQLSVSYLDMSGKVVATCLIGKNPDNLSAVYDHQINADGTVVKDGSGKILSKDRITKTETLISPNKPYDPNKGGSYNPNVVANNSSLKFTHLLLVDTDNTPVKITYKITPEKLEGLKCLAGENINVCYDCVYDLQITIVDACGEEKYNSNKIKIGNLSALNTCEGSTFTLSPDIDKTLMAGTYTITKVLTVNQESIDAYVNNYMAAYKLACKGEYKDYDQEFDAQDGISCADLDPCKACVEDLGNSYAAHVAKYGAEALTERSYYKELQECKDLCGNTELNQIIYQMLVADVSPGGQYGCTDLENECSNTSVFKTNNRLGANYLGFGNWRNPYFNVLQQKPGDLPALTAQSPEASLRHYYDEYGDIVYIPISINYNEVLDEPKFSDFIFEPNVWNVEESGVKSALGTIYLITYATEAKTLPSGVKIEPGQVEKVEVVAPTAYKNFYNDILPNQSYAVEPQHLHNVSDFTDKWQEAWGASLVTAHPEFCYYAYRANVTEKVFPSFNYTSEEFDEIISTKTVDQLTSTDGVEIGNYFENRVTTLKPLFSLAQAQDMSKVEFLLEHDPYFASSPDLMLLMLNKLKGQNSKDGLDLRKRVAATNRILPSTRTPENFGTELTEDQQKEVLAGSPNPPSETMSYDKAQTLFLVNDQAAAGEVDEYDLKDLDWQGYVAQYLSYKNEIIKDRANIYCDQKAGVYTQKTLPYGNNSCIGAESFNPFMSRSFSFTRWWFFNFVMQRFAPCNWWHHALYKTKTKRYNKEEEGKYDTYGGDVSANVDELVTKRDVEHYLKTDQFPMLRDLEFAISNIAQKTNTFVQTDGALTSSFNFSGKNFKYLGPSLFDYFSYGKPMGNAFKDYRYAINQYRLIGVFGKEIYGTTGSSANYSHLALEFKKISGNSVVAPNFGCGTVHLYLPSSVAYTYTLYKNNPSAETKAPHSAQASYVVPISFEKDFTIAPTSRVDIEDGAAITFPSRKFKVSLKNISNLKYTGSYMAGTVKTYKFIAKAAFQIIILGEQDEHQETVLSTVSYTVKGETCIPIDGSLDPDLTQTCVPSKENIAMLDLLNGLAGTQNLYCGNHYTFDRPTTDQNRAFEETYNVALNKYITGVNNDANIPYKQLNVNCTNNAVTPPSGNNTDTSEDVLGEITGSGGSDAGPVSGPSTTTNTNTVPLNQNTLTASSSVTIEMPAPSPNVLQGLKVKLTPVINGSSVLQSVVLTNIQGFTDLKEGSKENTFTITAWVNNGGGLVPMTFEGEIMADHGTSNTNFKNFVFKECGPGIPMECDNEPNRNRVGLEQMLNELAGNDLNAQDVFKNLTDGTARTVNLTQNSTFQQKFKYKFTYLPVDQPTTGTNTPVNANTPISLDENKKPLYANCMKVQVTNDAGVASNTGKHLSMIIGNSRLGSQDEEIFTNICEMNLDLSTTDIVFDDIVGFRNLKASNNTSVTNPGSSFVITAVYYKNDAFGTVLLTGSTCLPLDNCSPGCEGLGSNELVNGDFKDPAFEVDKKAFDSDFDVAYKDVSYGYNRAYIAQTAPDRHYGSATGMTKLRDHTGGGLGHMLLLENRFSTEGAQSNAAAIGNRLWYQTVSISKAKDYILEAFVSNTSQMTRYPDINTATVKLTYETKLFPKVNTRSGSLGFTYTFRFASSNPTVTAAFATCTSSTQGLIYRKMTLTNRGTLEMEVPYNDITSIDLSIRTNEYGLLNLNGVFDSDDMQAYVADLATYNFANGYHTYSFTRMRTESFTYLPIVPSNASTPKITLYYKDLSNPNAENVTIASLDEDILYYDQGWQRIKGQLEYPWADNDPNTKNIEVGIIVEDLGYFTLAFDDISLKTDCGVQVDAAEIEVVDNCEAYKSVVADINTEYFNIELEAKTRARIQKQYIDKCLTAAEEMISEYDQFAYQFTLYYYDQSGNLIKTVPPEGVRLITDKDALAQIETLRDENKYDLRYVPQHTMATTYRYNSLNQLVSQSLPDHEQFNIWNVSDPTETAYKPAPNLTVKDAEFLGLNDGIMLANNAADISSIYVTDDQAKQWNKITKIGIKDINAVQYVDDNTVIAVLNEGKLLKSTDKGHNWVIYNTGLETDLVGLDFIVNTDSKLEGMIIDRLGNINTVTDIGVGTWNSPGTVVGKPEGINYIKAFQRSGTATLYYLTVNISKTGLPQRDYLYKLSHQTGTWTWQEINIQAAYKFNKVLLGNNNQYYAVGDHGLLASKWADGVWDMSFVQSGGNLVSTAYAANGDLMVRDDQNRLSKRKGNSSSGYTWSTYINNIVGDINGALVDKTGKSYNPSTWALDNSFYLGTSPKTVKLFDGYKGSSSASRSYETYVDASNKLNAKTITPGPTPLQLPTTMKKMAAWAELWMKEVAGSNPQTYTPTWDFAGMCVDADNKIYNIYHGTAVEQLYKDGNNQTLSFKFIEPNHTQAFRESDATGTQRMLAIASDNKIYTLTYGVETPTATYKVDMPAGVAATSITAMGYDDANNIILASGAILHQYKAGAWSSSAQYYAPSLEGMSVKENMLTVAGSNGTILKHNMAQTYAELLYTNLPDVDYVDLSIDPSTGTGVAITTTAVHNLDNWNSVEAQSMPSDEFQKTIIEKGTDQYIIGTNRNLYAYNSATGSFGPETSDKVSVLDIAQRGTEIVAVGNSGSIAYKSSTDWALPMQIDPLKLCALSVSPVAGSETVYAIGKAGTLVKSKNKGLTWTAIKNKATTDFRAIAAINNDIAFMGGFDGKIYKLDDNNVTVAYGSNTKKIRDAYFNKGVLAFVTENGTNEGPSVIWSKNILNSNGTVNPSPTFTVETFSTGGNKLNALYVYDENNIYLAGDAGTLVQLDIRTATAAGSRAKLLKKAPPSTSNWTTANLRDISFTDYNVGYAVGDNGTILKTVNRGETWINKSVSGNTENYVSLASMDANNFYLSSQSGTQAGGAMLTEFSDKISGRFWYDKLGRLIVSQNTKQYKAAGTSYGADGPAGAQAYSYMLYDVMGRLYEGGEVLSTATLPEGLNVSDAAFQAWFTAVDNVRREITRTYYTEPQFKLNLKDFVQENLINRVASVTYQKVETHGYLNAQAGDYDHAQHYTYDIHGNVSTLITESTLMAQKTGHRYKRMDYDYDLLSGNVNTFSYQRGEVDQFLHRYEYDADNRLIHAYTSADGIRWDHDLAYDYYRHGPMSRTELGEHNIQGLDYAYTLQGWIKGVNGESLNSQRDIGTDGAETGDHQYFAKDQFGYTLGYFTNDYQSISNHTTNTNFHGGSFTIPETTNQVSGKIGGDLFNGNISHMVTSIRPFVEAASSTERDQQILYSAYRYDQLNRIREVQKASSATFLTDNTWANATTTAAYHESFTYDKNGNILTLERKDKDGADVDNFKYNYHTIAKGYLENTNKLRWVDDDVLATKSTEDIDDQDQDNYVYDAIGNLIKDEKEGIAEIQWNVSGKVNSVLRTPAAATNKSNLYFGYDAMGQRSHKLVSVKDAQGNTTERYTFYVRDASGNAIAHYSYEGSPNTNGAAKLEELSLYGSSRLGMKKVDQVLPAPQNTLSNTGVAYDANNSNHVLLQGATDYTLLTGQEGYVVTGTNFTGNISMGEGSKLYILGTASPNSITHTGTSEVQILEGGSLSLQTLQMTAAATYKNYGTLSFAGNCNLIALSKLENHKELRIAGDLNMAATASLYTKGSLFVAGNLTANSSTLQVYGFAQVAGTVLLDQNSTAELHGQSAWLLGALNLSNGAQVYNLETATADIKIQGDLSLATGTHIQGTIRLCAEGNVTGATNIASTVNQNACAFLTFLLPGESRSTRALGAKVYELSNHLGNVLVTVTDKKTLLSPPLEGSGVAFWLTDVVSATDYYAFGSSLRSSGTYRYGFNGQEKETELNSSITSAEYWMYDGRLARRWNLDPVDQISESNYAVMHNCPIILSDVNGDNPTGEPPSDKGSNEGETKTIYTERYFADEIHLTVNKWFWHSGAIRKEGWYSEEDYKEVLTPATQSLAYINGDIKFGVEFPSKETFYHFIMQSPFTEESFKTTLSMIEESYSDKAKQWEYAHGHGVAQPCYPEDIILGVRAAAQVATSLAVKSISISLGKQAGTSLSNFSVKTGAPFMNEWKRLGIYTKDEIGENVGFDAVFKLVTDKVVKTNGKINFNLNLVNISASKNIIGKGLYEGLDSPFMSGLITEWELAQIMTNKALLNQTKFYKMGIEIPTNIVKKYFK